MLWKHEPIGQCFNSFFIEVLPNCSSVEIQNMLSISFGKFRDKKENTCILFILIIRM